jgi:hypothetical protein
LINANAMLDRDRDRYDIDHGFDAIGYQLWLIHEACAEGTALDAIAGAAAVQIDFVVTPLLAQFGGKGQIVGVAAAQLQSHRVFFIVKAQVSLNAAMSQCTRGDHFGIKQGVLS